MATTTPHISLRGGRFVVAVAAVALATAAPATAGSYG
jgi:hypothetical protein